MGIPLLPKMVDAEAATMAGIGTSSADARRRHHGYYGYGAYEHSSRFNDRIRMWGHRLTALKPKSGR